MMRRTVLLSALCALGTLPGCEILEGLDDEAKALLPEVTYNQATLVQSPSSRMMSSYFCPKVLTGTASLACLAFDAPPTPEQMKMAFRLNFRVKNPNNFPIPLLEMLTAITLFPSGAKQSLGATCFTLCDPADSTCTGVAGPGACQSNDQTVKSMDDFGNAATNLLFATGLQLAQGTKPTFQVPKVSSNEELDLSAIFSFGADPMLAAIEELATQSVGELATGHEPTFRIPFELLGTVWSDVGSMGKASVGFGPVQEGWTVPTQALVPEF